MKDLLRSCDHHIPQRNVYGRVNGCKMTYLRMIKLSKEKKTDNPSEPKN